MSSSGDELDGLLGVSGELSHSSDDELAVTSFALEPASPDDEALYSYSSFRTSHAPFIDDDIEVRLNVSAVVHRAGSTQRSLTRAAPSSPRLPARMHRADSSSTSSSFYLACLTSSRPTISTSGWLPSLYFALLADLPFRAYFLVYFLGTFFSLGYSCSVSTVYCSTAPALMANCTACTS